MLASWWRASWRLSFKVRFRIVSRVQVDRLGMCVRAELLIGPRAAAQTG